MLFIGSFVAFAAWCFTGHPNLWVAGGLFAAGLLCVIAVDVLERK